MRATEVERVTSHTMERSYVQYGTYIRWYWAVAIIWAVFTMCFTIINIIVFIEPQWLGSSDSSPGRGYFGLFQYCEFFNSATTRMSTSCVGSLDNFSDILSASWKATTVLIGVSCLFMFLCDVGLIFFIFGRRPSLVFVICGCLQLCSGLCMFIGCVIYPVGWDHDVVRRVCGVTSERYSRATCEIRWAYILAMIGIFDVLILAILAFVLATRFSAGPKQYGYSKSDLMETESKPSMIIHPAVASSPRNPDTQPESVISSASKRTRNKDFSL